MMYLPDITNINTKAVDRVFLFNIVNTVDPHFFREEVERQEELKRQRIVQ